MSSVSKGSFKSRLAERIDAGKILDRLTGFFMGNLEDIECPECKHVITAPIKLTSTQVRAGSTVLGKALPDLKAIEKTIIDQTKKSKEDITNQLIAQGFSVDQAKELWTKAAQQTRH